MPYLISLFLLSIALSSFSQECNYDLAVSVNSISVQKVKTIDVFAFDKGTNQSKHLFKYYFQPNGFANKVVRYSQNQAGEIIGETECSCSTDSTVFINSGYAINSIGEKKLFGRKELRYNSSHQLILQSIETFEGNYLRHITRYNPNDKNETNLEVIAYQDNDTIRHSINKRNKTVEESVIREKKNGIWEVKKQVLTKLADGRKSYQEFLNGTLTLNKTIENITEQTYEADYGLPNANTERKDTTLIESKMISQQYKNAIQKKLLTRKITRIRQYQTPESKQPYNESYYTNGLPLIDDALNLDYFLYYSYDFR